MNNRTHYLNLYQKPALGTSYLRQYKTYNYRHSINAIGGFDTASCDVAIRSRDEGQQFLDQYLGNFVRFMVDDPLNPIWEGFINRMTFSAGGVQYTISLDEMANRVIVTFSGTDGSTATTQTASASSTASSDIYGIKQLQLDLGYLSGGSVSGARLRDTILAQRAYPKTSILPGGGGDLLHIECLGFYHTLTWEDYRQATSALVATSTLLGTIITGVVNGSTFFDDTDTSGIETNALTTNQQAMRGETVWDMLTKIRELGDATNYFVIGITPTNFATGLRTFYYRTASSTVTYTARQSDGLRIRNLYGQLVDPWRVRPDTGIRVSDMLIGWNGVGDNPTETYILKVDYDANQQSCIYSGDDDLTAEGIFNLKRFHRKTGAKLGTDRRLA